MAVSAVIVIGVLFLSIDYFRVRGQYGELGELRKIAESRKTQIDELSVKVNEFEERMTVLKEFDRRSGPSRTWKASGKPASFRVWAVPFRTRISGTWIARRGVTPSTTRSGKTWISSSAK
jgi:hypothetical protein